MTEKTPLIWALVDGRPGNNSQILGVCEALGVPFVIKNIHYNKLGRIPNIFKGKTLLGITKAAKKEICPPWPDIVISVARKMESTALYIKKHSPKTKLVHIQKPDLPFHHFDIIAMPEHDLKGDGGNRKPESFFKGEHGSKIIITPGAPNRITEKLLLEAKEKWETKFGDLLHPRIAVLVGGDNKLNKFTDAHAEDLADKVNKLLEESGGGSLMVTTSRRTPPEAINILKEKLSSPKFFYDFRDGGENPYTGLLACADVIIPSGDSVSMCSESCTTGKPVYIYSPKGLTSKKHDRFIETIIAKGYARALGASRETWSYTPLDDSKAIADFIRANCC